MEMFRALMELLGSVSLIFVAVSMCVWAPMIMTSLRRIEKYNLEAWVRHFEFEQKKLDALARHMRKEEPEPDQEDLN